MRKSQGEIFGIALMFVVIIVGILIYSQISALNPNNTQNSLTNEKYKILSDGTLNSILKMSTGCEVERGKDSVADLVKYCEYTYYNTDPKITCNDGNSYPACQKVINTFNATLLHLFNDSSLGSIPFELIISAPSDTNSILNINITNLGLFNYKKQVINTTNYLRYGFNKAPSGHRVIPTARRSVEFQLYLFYR